MQIKCRKHVTINISRSDITSIEGMGTFLDLQMAVLLLLLSLIKVNTVEWLSSLSDSFVLCLC